MVFMLICFINCLLNDYTSYKFYFDYNIINTETLFRNAYIFFLCYRSFTYTINKKNPGHVLVIANVVPVELHLSARELILNPIPGYLEETEFRKTVRVCNPGNCSAEFTWIPITTQKGTAFSIQPTKGILCNYNVYLECQ